MLAGGEGVAPVGALVEAVAPERLSWGDLGVSEATGRMYRREVQAFVEWCRSEGVVPFPCLPRTVVRYLEFLSERGMAAASIERIRAAISVGHEVAFTLAREQGGEVPPNPTRDILVRAALHRCRRVKTGRRKKRSQKRAKRAIRFDALGALVAGTCEQSRLTALRDTAILTVGWWGMLRRSEIVSLRAEDMRYIQRAGEPDGIEILLRQSKTDQTGQGAVVTLIAVPGDSTCPVEALGAWLDESGIESGPIFRAINRYGQITDEALSPQSVRLVVLRAADASGSAKTLRMSAHGLRSGAATELAAAGGDIREIMAKGRWASPSVAMRYIRLGASVTTDPMRKIVVERNQGRRKRRP